MVEPRDTCVDDDGSGVAGTTDSTCGGGGGDGGDGNGAEDSIAENCLNNSHSPTLLVRTACSELIPESASAPTFKLPRPIKTDLDMNVDPRRALRLELQKRRPAVFRLRKICRGGLEGKIPADLRGDIWQLLMGVESKDRFLLDDSIRDTTQDLENQRVIRVDAQRTRADVPAFREPVTEVLVSKLLTFYCKRKAISYKQGLNEVLAPFIMLRQNPSLPDGTVFNLFYAFIDRFLPHMFVHEEFNALQCTFRLFRLLLLYHDPELCIHLDTHCMSPELYSTPWFLTMFARNVPLGVLYRLWDLYLLEEDDCGAELNMFIALALMIENRQGLLSSDPSDLPIFVTGVLGPGVDNGGAKDGKESSRSPKVVGSGGTTSDLTGSAKILSLVDSLDAIVLRARQLRRATPALLGESFNRAVLHRSCPGFNVVERFEAQPCVFMAAKQLVALITNKRRTRDMVIRAVDCRSKQAFEEEHLVGSLHLNPDLLELPDFLIKATDALKVRCSADDVNIHVVFISDTPGSDVGRRSRGNTCAMEDETTGASGSTHSRENTNDKDAIDRNCNMLLLYAIQRGFKRVSMVESGWDAVKAAAGSDPAIFEHGASIDQLLDEPIIKSRTTALDSLKEAIKIDTLKGALGMISGLGSDRESSSSSTSEIIDGSQTASNTDTASPTWLQKLGKNFVGDKIATYPPTSSTSPHHAQHRAQQQDQQRHEEQQESQQRGLRSFSLMSRVVNKMKTLGTDLSATSSFGSEGNAKSEGNDTASSAALGFENSDDEDPDAGWIDVRLWRTPVGAKQTPRDELHFFPVHPVEKGCSNSIDVCRGPDENISGDESASPMLAVSSGYILLLQPHPERVNFAHIEQKWLLGDLLKITSMKSVQNLVIFHFKTPETNAEPVQKRFIVSGARECIDRVKVNYSKLQR